jgi:hypothetical protein
MMAFRALDPADDRPAVQPATRKRPAVPAPMTPAVLLDLQRSAGNAVVGQLMRSARPNAATVQRQPAGPAAVEAPRMDLIPDLRLGSQFFGPGVRADVRRFKAQIGAVRKLQAQHGALIDRLKWEESVGGGAAAAKAVGGIGAEVDRLGTADRLKLAGRIDAFDTKRTAVRVTTTNIKSANSAVQESLKKLESATLSQSITTAKHDKVDAEKNLQDLKDKQDSTLKILNQFLDFSSMLIDPKKGWGAVLSTAKGMAKEWAKDEAFSGIDATAIAAATNKIAVLTGKIRTLEDQKAMADVAAAALNLQSAQRTLEGLLEQLRLDVRSAESSQHDLDLQLRRSGRAGRAAAEAINDTTNVIQVAADATARSQALGSALRQLDSRSARLADGARKYREALASGLGTLSEATGGGTPAQQRAWARDALDGLIAPTKSWDAWTANQLVSLGADDEYVKNGAYRTGYVGEGGIEDSLHGVRKTMKT